MSNERIPFTEKLNRLQISQEDFDFYVQTFVSCRMPYIRNIGDGWLQAHNRLGSSIPLSDNGIAYHLLHHYSIGVVGGKCRRAIGIDLDNRHETNLTERYTLIRSALNPATPIVFQSSQSKGLHLFYLLERPISTEKALKVFERRLHRANIAIRSGSVELLPTPAKPMRLPLGPGSKLLDADTLLPLTDTVSSSIRWLRENAAARTYPVTTFFCDSLPDFEGKHQTPITVQSNYAHPHPEYEYLDEKARLILLRPIPEYGTRHQLTLSLIRFFWAQGYQDHRTAFRIREWYDRFKGEHKSITLAQDRKGALQELARMVRSFYGEDRIRQRGSGLTTVRSQTIPLALARRLVDVVRESATGTLLDANHFRTLQWGFTLLQLYRYNDKNEMRIPAVLMKKFPGASPRSYEDRRDFWIGKGLLTETATFNLLAHRATTYRLLWPLPKTGDVSCIEDAVKRLFTAAELEEMFEHYLLKRFSDAPVQSDSLSAPRT